jgi:hypothetical protein
LARREELPHRTEQRHVHLVRGAGRARGGARVVPPAPKVESHAPLAAYCLLYYGSTYYGHFGSISTYYGHYGSTCYGEHGDTRLLHEVEKVRH